MTRLSPQLQLARMLAAAIPALLLGGAYLSQYGFGLFPCEMCWWQRYAHFAALGLAILAFALPSFARAFTLLSGFAILTSGLIGGFHAGVEYHWWEGFTSCSTPPMANGSDPLAAILAAPVIRCDQAQWELFHVSLAGWNFLFSTTAALAILWLIAQAREITR